MWTAEGVFVRGNPNPGQILEQLALSNKEFRAFVSGGATAARKKKAPLGTVVRYTLTEPANVAFTVQLKPGAYRLVAVATDSAGLHSPTLSAKFVIVK